MVIFIFIFVVGLICGVVVTRTHLALERKKIKLYETYIHRRLDESLPYLREHAGFR